jgi:ribonuclease VapC
VDRELTVGGTCSAANWSEVAQRLIARRQNRDLARALLVSYGLVIEPVYDVDGERAAVLWRAGSGLSLADRLCLATAERLAATVWTADTAWGNSSTSRQVR